jgi:hypothetical protein
LAVRDIQLETFQVDTIGCQPPKNVGVPRFLSFPERYRHFLKAMFSGRPQFSPPARNEIDQHPLHSIIRVMLPRRFQSKATQMGAAKGQRDRV